MTREQKGTRMMNAAWATCILVALLSGSAAQAGQAVSFGNGIRATIHTAGEISAQLLDQDKGLPVLVHPVIGSVALLDNQQEFFPFEPDQVIEALARMHGFVTDVDVEIFLLPAPPAEVGGSYASRGAIYLAPGTGPVDPQTAAYITTHEMGHVLTWAFIDGHDLRWDRYLDLRGLDAVVNGPSADHADRAREILAEDFRFLFGGPLATASGSIENHFLVTPDRVDGLQELLQGFVEGGARRLQMAASTAFPNPCNPLTTVEMNIQGADAALDADQAVLRIYDVRGALVRTVAEGYRANDRVSIQWDGTDRSGAAAASGRYLYVMQLGSMTARGAVTMIR